MLELSGAVRASENPSKNVCGNANRHAHGAVHLVVFAHLQKKKVLELMLINLRKKERCFGILRILGWLLE